MKRALSCVIVVSAAVPVADAVAATVVAVDATRHSATLELTEDELKQARKGARLTLTLTEGKAPLVAEVVRVKGKRALVRFAPPAATDAAATAATVTPGSRVQLAAAAPLVAPVVKAAAPVSTVPATARAPAILGVLHPTQMNPAQIRRIDRLHAEAGMGLVSDEYSARGDDAEAAVSLRGPQFRAATVLTDPELGMQLGLTIQTEELDGRIRFDVAEVDEDEKLTLTDTTIAPILGVRLPAWAGGEWFAGMTYKVVQRRYAGAYYEASHNLAYTRMQPGLLYATPAFEAGVTFEPKVNVESNGTAAPGIGDATVRVAEPARLTVHGRWQRRTDLAIQGSVTSNQNRMLNFDGETGWKNNLLLIGGAEKLLGGGVVIDGALHVYLPAYAGDGDKTVDNIARYGFSGNYARPYTDQVAIQAGLMLVTGDDDYTDADIGAVSLSRDTLRLTGGATYKF
jgi:hypothetical protein